MTDGTIKVEMCTSGVYVEWNFIPDIWSMDFELKTVSPAFEIGNQSYSLRSHLDIFGNYFKFSLSSAGPPPEKPIRCRAGLKCPDGNYVHGFAKLWSRDEDEPELLHINGLQSVVLGCVKSRESHTFTLCLHAQVDEDSAGTEACIHDSPEKKFSPSDGQIYEKECSCLKHVEWTLDFDLNGNKWKSPVFKIGNQLHRFAFHWDFIIPEDKITSDGKFLVLKLYWLGPSFSFSPIPALCWAGLKRSDGTYHHKNEKHKFCVMEEARNPQLNLMRVSPEEIRNHHLDRNKRITFFLRLNEETGAEPCNLDRPQEFPRGVGSIKRELLSPYILVQWTFAIGKINEVSSPAFGVDNQNYVLSFERQLDDTYSKCSLSRKGPFAQRHLLYLMTARLSDYPYEELGCATGLLNRQMTADLWFCETIIVHLPLSETWKEVAVYLFLTYDESPTPEKLWFSTLSQVEEDSIDSPEMDPSFVVFKVEDTAFKIHKAPILVFVPIFKSMLTNGYIESKTGVVTIKDCKAVVFKEFLELVEAGFQGYPSAKNALALYEVAQKYLLSRLKFSCYDHIMSNLSLDNICDVLELGFAYEDENLLGSASSFLSRNKDIVESVRFCDVFSRYPDAVKELERRVTDPQERHFWRSVLNS